MAQVLPFNKPVTNSSVVRAGQRGRIFRLKVLPWLFVLPILLINFVVIIGPSLSAIAASFPDWNGIGTPKFIGLDNYQTMLTDPDYGAAFLHNLTWLLVFLTIPIAMALIAASFLAPIKRGGLLIRTALFIPYVLPRVGAASIVRNLLSPTLGIWVLLP